MKHDDIWKRPFKTNKIGQPHRGKVYDATMTYTGPFDPRMPPGVIKAMIGIVMAIDGLREVQRNRPDVTNHPEKCGCHTCNDYDVDGLEYQMRVALSSLEGNSIGEPACTHLGFRFPAAEELVRMFEGHKLAIHAG